MGELIDKAAVKAIIGKMQDCTMDEDGNFYSSSALAEYNILCDIENRLDTLEVKEVDFDKEINEWMKYGPHTSYPWCTIPDAIKITAEHFFELGLKTQKGE